LYLDVMFVPWRGESEESLAKLLEDTAVGKNRGRVLVFCDQKCTGETRTAPHVRTPWLREDQLSTLLGAVTLARNKKQGHIAPNDVILVPDASKLGGRHTITSGRLLLDHENNKVTPVSKSIYVTFSQSSAVARGRATRTNQEFSSLEFVYVLTAGKLNVQKRARLSTTPLSYDNRHDGIGPMEYHRWSDPSTWLLTYGEKKGLFGEDNRVSVGGTVEAEEVALQDLPPLSSEAGAEGFQEDTLPGLEGLSLGTGRGGQKPRPDSNLEVPPAPTTKNTRNSPNVAYIQEFSVACEPSCG
jgi:hypothetical protein